MNSENTENRDTVNSIIYEFNKQNADRIKDAAGQKVFQVNKQTGKVLSRLLSSFLPKSFLEKLQNSFSPVLPEGILAQIPDGYYIVSNSNFVHRVMHVSDKITVEDVNGRRIHLSIKCEISCAPGNEERVAIALLANGNQPVYNLNLFLKKCVYTFQQDIEAFISNFYASNIPGQIEEFIKKQKDPSYPSAHKTGLTFHSVKCLQIDESEKVIPINLRSIEVGFKGSVKRHAISLSCNLEISKMGGRDAHWGSIDKEDFEKIITKDVLRAYYDSISESDSFKKPDIVEAVIKKSLNNSLQRYNREIASLKLEDLYIKTVDARSRFEIDRERKNYLAADGENIGLKVPLSVKVTDLMELDRSYEKNTHPLKEKLIVCAESAIAAFIVRIKAGEFYKRMAKDAAFRKVFVEKIRQNINSLIEAEVTVTNVDYGITGGIIKTWTPFRAVIARDMREFVVTGSFMITKVDLSKIDVHMGQEIPVEKVKNKIIETLEARLAKRYSETPTELEKVAHDLLAETVSEAFGVIIMTQNIKAELTRLSPEDEAIITKINDLRSRKIELIARGQDCERLDEQILRLEEYREKLARESSQNLLPRPSYVLPDSKKS